MFTCRGERRVWLLLTIVSLAAMLGVTGTSAKTELIDPPDGLIEASPPTPMPAFQLPTFHGGSISSSDLQGKVIVLRFWTTW